MALTSYQALRIHHTKPACTVEAVTDKHISSPAQCADKHMAANAAPPHHMSSTDTKPEQGGTFRAFYMAITKTKPPHDSSHTTSSSNNNKPRQMICSTAHQGGVNKTPKWIITRKDFQSHQASPLPTFTVPELALLRANHLKRSNRSTS